MRERSEKVESPGSYVTECNPVFFRTALPFHGGYHLESVGIPLYDAFGINCTNGATTENQGAYMSSIWANG